MDHSGPPQTLAYNQALIDAVEACSDGIVVCDAEVEVTYVTPSMRPMLTGPVSEELFELLGEAVDGRGREISIDKGDKIDHPVRITGIPIRSGEHHWGGIAVVADRSNNGISDKVLSDFVANVSHELKTPIGALGLLAETLGMERDPVVVARLVERLQLESIRVTQVVDDLLNLSRIEGRAMEPPKLLRVEEVLQAAMSNVSYAAEHRQVRMSISDCADATIYGRHTDLVSALQHLLENGIKYSNRGTEIEVHCASSDGWTEIAVTDHGMGIAPKYLDRIFERFYRVDDARTRTTGGTGLGLSLVRYVAQHHGGDVSVTSKEGVGSTFTLRLPAHPSTSLPTNMGDHQ